MSYLFLSTFNTAVQGKRQYIKKSSVVATLSLHGGLGGSPMTLDPAALVSREWNGVLARGHFARIRWEKG